MYQMTETEYKFAELIWEEEPIGSGGAGKAVRVRSSAGRNPLPIRLLKSFVRTVFSKNENAIVSSVLNKEEYHRAQGEAFVEKAYGGSLPKMIAAFIQSKKLSAEQIAEIEAMIEDYKRADGKKQRGTEGRCGAFGKIKYYCDYRGSMLI